MVRSRLLDTLQPNIRFLIRRAWHLRWSAIDESVALAEAALEHCEDCPKTSRGDAAEAHLVLAWNTKWRGQFEQSRAHCEEALSGFGHSGDLRWLPLVHSLTSIIEFDSGEYGKCEAALDLAHESLSHQVPAEASVDVFCSSAALARLRGDFDVAHELLMHAGAQGTGAETGRVAHNMARCLAAEGHYIESVAYGLQSVAASHTAKNYAVLPYVYEILAVSHIKLQAYDRAAGNISDGIHYALKNGDTRALIQLDIARALLESRVGDAARAEEMLRSSINDARNRRFGWHIDTAQKALEGIGR